MSDADAATALIPATSCAFSEHDFIDLLAEAPVNIDRLREASRLGIPARVRGEVWKYLLGVSRPDHTENFAAQTILANDFASIQQRTFDDADCTKQLSPELLKQLRAEIRRHFANLQRQFEENEKNGEAADSQHDAVYGGHLRLISSHESDGSHGQTNLVDEETNAETQPNLDGAGAPYSVDSTELSSAGSTLATGSGIPYDVERLLLQERIILMYLSSYNAELHLSAVYLIAPFLHTMSDPCSIYFSFVTLQEYIESIETSGMDRLLAKFLMLFRTFEPELCSHFEDEELRPNEWAIHWIRHLLCAQLPFHCVLRLWDTYFARNADVDLHMFVCLAILSLCKESLLECEYSELKGSLQHLPSMDVDHLLGLANNMQNQARAAWAV